MESIQPVDWAQLLLALGQPVDRKEIKSTAGEQGEYVVGPVDEDRIRLISSIVDGLETPRQRFLALWRLLPGKLDQEFARIPDHSVINHHADITARLWASRQQDACGGAYLSFALGPVQPFIEAARSVRDLWTGSAILSWLAFRAMGPIIDCLGPTAFVYPLLRSTPLMDLWLRKDAGIDRIPEPEIGICKCPSLPHRFVAVIPWGPDGQTADLLARQCEGAVREAWTGLAGKVRAGLEPALGGLCRDWDRLWCAQIEDFFDIRTIVVPERILDDDEIAPLIDGYAQDTSGRWQAHMDFSARVMESNRAIRHVPASQEVRDSAHRAPPKCSLFGSWEQMGPADLKESAEFWEAASKKLNMNGVRLRNGERFCAVALTKRFAGPAVLADELGLDSGDLRFPDTATVAAANWLEEAGIDPARHHMWNGRWLHDSGDDDELPLYLKEKIRNASRIGKPPSYYAILKMDGDDIGGWLRGDKARKLEDVLPGPDRHAAISAALGYFASHSAPRIVNGHNGTVIYSGGDDLLALLPASRAAACASELQEAYRKGDDKSPGMGEQATISAGITYVHHMEDLRLALKAAREAEGEAKKGVKDALYLHFMRRSGEHAGALLPWPGTTGWFRDMTGLYDCGASDRWAYTLRAELPVLASDIVPDGAVSAEIRRLGNRIDDPRWKDFASPQKPGDLIAKWWTDYREIGTDRGTSVQDALHAFVTLCQGAAFVARGRDG